MRLLLDEDVPRPLLPLLGHLLRGHQVEHVYTVGWKGKKDRPLFADAKAKKYHAVLTNNIRQLSDPDECTAIQRSGLHWISYTLDHGIDGLALASAAICAAIGPVVAELSKAPAQRIVEIQALAKRKRYKITDPATQPPSKYWP